MPPSVTSERARLSPLPAADAASGRGPKPATFKLMDDWKEATVEEALTDLARKDLNPQYRQAIGAAQQQAGRKLTDDEVGDVVGQVDKKLLKGARAKVVARLAGDPNRDSKLISDSVGALHANAAQMRDPFGPVTAGDPRARARETVLFENPRLMVLVDRFSASPKVLVVPKQAALTPLDLPPATLDEMSRIAAKASEAFRATSRSAPADVWINPPGSVTLRQVHVHVQPGLPDFSEQLSPGELANPNVAEARLATMQGAYWKKYEAALQKRLSSSPR